jgi:hypothetical protein
LIGHAGQATDRQYIDRDFEALGPLKARVASYGFAFAPATVFDKSYGLLVSAELDSDPKYIPFLLGAGIRVLSVYPKFLPNIQKLISNLRISDAKTHAERLLAENSLKGTEAVLQRSKRIFGINEAG